MLTEETHVLIIVYFLKEEMKANMTKSDSAHHNYKTFMYLYSSETSSRHYYFKYFSSRHQMLSM